VIISAPSKTEEVHTVVYGTSPKGAEAQVVSCASCTTNCITPVVEIMARRIGIKKATMTTIHAYTSSQGIVDGPKNCSDGASRSVQLCTRLLRGGRRHHEGPAATRG
jgi:glyceraldehyde 3-phosphate dehydrogenase